MFVGNPAVTGPTLLNCAGHSLAGGFGGGVWYSHMLGRTDGQTRGRLPHAEELVTRSRLLQ